MHKKQVGHEGVDDRRNELIAKMVRAAYRGRTTAPAGMYKRIERAIKEADLLPMFSPAHLYRVIQMHVHEIVLSEITQVDSDCHWRAQDSKERSNGRRRKG